MREKDAPVANNSAHSGAVNGPEILDVSDSASIVAEELSGALLPAEHADASLGSSAEPKRAEKKAVCGLGRWGPWSRWCLYRETEGYALKSSESLRNRDAEQNARGKLPDDEGLQVPAIWVSELYTPSTVGGLLQGIRDLGWDYGRNRDDSLSKWMNDVREGRQAGWTSLGLVSPPDFAHFMSERTAKLPAGATAALPILMSITPSLTAFIVVFLFDDETARSLEVSLRADFKTSKRRDPHYRPWHLIRYILLDGPIRLARHIYSPDLIRREAVKARIQELENSCVNWVRGCLPGAFASMPGAKYPTAILMLTEQVKPLSSEARHVVAFDGLTLNRDYDAWESDDWRCARMVLPRGWDNEGRMLIFACRRQDTLLDCKHYHDPGSNWAIAQMADMHVRGLLARWAITCLLDSYHQDLSILRDQSARDGKYRPVRDLKELRSLARTRLYDICACTQDIVEFTGVDSLYRYDVIEMSYVNDKGDGKRRLLSDLKSSQDRRARQVQREATLVQSTLSISNDLSHTISNIRIQRLVVLLTVVSISIALLALAF